MYEVMLVLLLQLAQGRLQEVTEQEEIEQEQEADHYEPAGTKECYFNSLSLYITTEQYSGCVVY